MPHENIDRALKRGTGAGEAVSYEDLTYEVYGPHGVAMLVELSTDNRNRTAAEVRSLLTKNGGAIATAGSVTRLFHRKGQMIITRATAAEDKVMEAALEAGAEDFMAEPEGYVVTTEPAKFESVHKAIEAKGVKCASASVTFLPDLRVPLLDSTAISAVTHLIELLEEDDDVKEVYTNAEFPHA